MPVPSEGSLGCVPPANQEGLAPLADLVLRVLVSLGQTSRPPVSSHGARRREKGLLIQRTQVFHRDSHPYMYWPLTVGRDLASPRLGFSICEMSITSPVHSVGVG